MANKNRRRRPAAGRVVSVPSEQGVVRVPVNALPMLPTKATKAQVAAVVLVAGLVGIHLTSGVAQLVVMGLQLALVVFSVWRTRNAPKVDPPSSGPGVGEFL